MTGAARSHPASAPPPPLTRLGLALAASALVHWLLLSPLPGDTPWQRRLTFAGAAPLTVRLAPVPLLVPEVPAAAEPGASHTPRLEKPSLGRTRSLPGEDSSADSRPPALPQALDPNYYAARDLDDYPRPLAPLSIDRLARDGAGEVRLEILIDERGVVRDVVFAFPARPGAAEEGLRAALAATPFLPARKDGRAVKSRVMLRLDLAPADGVR